MKQLQKLDRKSNLPDLVWLSKVQVLLIPQLDTQVLRILVMNIWSSKVSVSMTARSIFKSL